MKDLKGHLDHMDMINEEAARKCFQSPNKNIHDDENLSVSSEV